MISLSLSLLTNFKKRFGYFYSTTNKDIKAWINPRIRFFMLPDQRVLHRKYFGDVLVTKTDHLLHECLPCFKVPLRNPRKILKLSTLFRNSETNCEPILLNTLCKIIHLLTSYLSLGVL